MIVCGGVVAMLGSGCVSMDRYRSVEAKNRRLAAEKVGVETELQDERSVTDSLRVRITALEGEVRTKDELVANLRSENDAMHEMLGTTKTTLEILANQKPLGSVNILGAKLPAPLDSALKGFAESHPGAVIYDAAHGNVKWRADLLFALGSDVVVENSKGALRDFSEVLKSSAAADFEVVIVGHTDDKPIKQAATRAAHPSNWHLAAHRAISVSRVLLDYGYAPERVIVAGCSEYRPVASNSSDSGAAQNRRVEIYLVPRGSITGATPITGGQPGPDRVGLQDEAPE
jgi:chemotaxis protein MotB